VARTSPRRVSLPSADDLFRPSDPTPEQLAQELGESAHVRAVPDAPDDTAEDTSARRRTSGRVRHDEKMTVYVTADELLDLEHARLALRRDHGLAVDRGRLVREAVSLVLADLEEHGFDSMLVQRLTEK
jgi:hypothetical protein